MTRLTLRIFWLCAFALGAVCSAQGAAPKVADWTLLIYVNGKNNLEGAAITDFYEMAEVGSTSQVNVIAQVGRPKLHYSTLEGGWSGVYRFHVKKGQKPRPNTALVDLEASGLNTNMADPKTLEDFIRWGAKTFPAKRTMLVIWNHGQGQRFQLAEDESLKQIASKSARSSDEIQKLAGQKNPPSTTAGHRAISSDDDTKGILYNRQVQDTLEKLKAEKIEMDVVGFDACLMAMIETAYALRKTAKLMVASEELEPANGWNYRTILKTLVSKPSMDAKALSGLLVARYRDQYQNGDRTTLSAVDLSSVEPLAIALSQLSEHLLANLSVQRPLIWSARSKVKAFADWDNPPLRTSIDLEMFLTALKSKNPDPKAVALIDDTLKLLKKSVIANYRASPVVDDGYGGNGLAVYFPADKQTFLSDRFHDGYLPENKLHPLEIVTSPATSGWSRLVLKLLE